MPRDPRADIQDIIDAVARAANAGTTLDELNAMLARGMMGYNARPQADLGGLSPDQMSQLLHGDWIATGALRISRGLTAQDVGETAFLDDARLLMRYVDEHSPLRPTAKNNLPRSAVMALLPELRTAGYKVERFGHEYTKSVNENDLIWLPVIRFTLETAKLITKRRGFMLSRRGRELLTDAAAGELYSLLFATLMREVDLRTFDNRDDQRGLQSTLPFTFWRLRLVTEWTSPEALVDSAWLDDAKEPPDPRSLEYGIDSRVWTFRSRVLEPLLHFGLLEERVLPSDVPWRSDSEFRITPLYNQFFQFAFDSAKGNG